MPSSIKLIPQYSHCANGCAIVTLCAQLCLEAIKQSSKQIAIENCSTNKMQQLYF